MLNLLKLDEQVKAFILGLDDSDARLKIVTERKLRPLAQIAGRESQRKKFWEMIGCEDVM